MNDRDLRGSLEGHSQQKEVGVFFSCRTEVE